MSVTCRIACPRRRPLVALPRSARAALAATALTTFLAGCTDEPPTGPKATRDLNGPLAALAAATNGKIAFESIRDGNLEIYAMNADGSEQTRMTNNTARDHDPAWSPDGTKLAFVSDRDGNPEVYVMNADGSGQTNLTNNPAIDGKPDWSPDGTRLAFQSFRDGRNDIYVMNADGSGPINLTNNEASESEPAWSPDGTRLAFTRSDGNREIYVMNADGSGQTRLTNNTADDGHADWSPDGTELAFQSNRDGNHAVFVMNADGSGQTNLTNLTTSESEPDWSPDGTKIVFRSHRESTGEIYVMNADGSAPTNLTNNPTSFDGDPAWQPLPAREPTPNGKIAFTRLGASWTILVVNPDGTGETAIAAGAIRPGWSPDGTRLVIERPPFFGAYPDIFVMNADGSGLTNMTNHQADDQYPAWSPTGTRLVFTSSRPEGSGLFVMNADGSEQTHLTNYGGFAAWSPDGTKIAFHSNHEANPGEIYVINADGTGLVRLTNNDTHDLHAAWSPDGSKIAFGRYQHPYFQVFVMNADGSGAVNLTNHPSDNGEPAWSPDGTKIAFGSNRDGNSEIYVMNADGSGQTRVTFNASNDVAPDWQPRPTLPQTITFVSAPPATAAVGGSYAMSATGGASSRPVIFASLTRSVCTVSGSVATFVAAGSCTVAAEQAGNAVYLPAAQIIQSFAVTGPGVTPVGSGVTVHPVDATTGQPSRVSLTFSSVTAGGTTTVTSGTIGDGSGPPPPSGFRLGSPRYYYDITTSATYSGPITVCIDYTGTTFGNEDRLKLLHGDGSGNWTDVTTSRDTDNNIICGTVASLSPFLVAQENAAPVVTSITLPTAPVVVNTAVELRASFTDADAADTHTATIDWGNGSTAGTVDQTAKTVAANGTYSHASVYTVQVEVNDGNRTGSRSSVLDNPAYIVVYDPSAGFITGGGWFLSQPGWCQFDVVCQGAEGKASFGFVSSYRKGATVPTGETEFRFQAGGLDFASSSYDWLVVNQAGTNAQFKGTGRINGAGTYKFTIWATDGTPDRFRIRIWQEDAAGVETVVYDNGFEQPIGGGSIMVHRK